MSDPIIRIEGLFKRFGGTGSAVDGIDLEIERGAFFSLLGPSGCGKTTLLRLLAGLERPDAGRILIDGVDVTVVPPWLRPVNMMFQSYALFPHMSVADNVAFGLRREGRPGAEVKERVARALDMVRMEAFARRRPAALSGGERQRVALARALVKEPKILLLDEPLAALDRKLREHTRLELAAIQRRVGITFVMVTHDQEEALSISTGIAVMARGRILQIGTPREIYDRPANRFVADFVGEANLLDGHVAANAAFACHVAVPGVAVPLVARASVPPPLGAAVTVMVRPENLAVTVDPPQPRPANLLAGRVETVAFLGDTSLCRIALPGGPVLSATLPHRPGVHIGVGDAVHVGWPAEAAAVLTS